MYSVNQPWDPLNACVVGRSYPPEFYSFITNSRLRNLFERIAIETEEDFQGIIKKLKEFDVDIVRPNVPERQVDQYLTSNNRIPGPISMVPRDQMIMIGNKFFVFPYDEISVKASGRSVGVEDPKEIAQKSSEYNWWAPIVDQVRAQGNQVIENRYHDILNTIPANGITRCGRDLYFGSGTYEVPGNIQDANIRQLVDEFFPDYRCHALTTLGHIDGCFTPIKPGLIVSVLDQKHYADTFPDWEVVYLEGESWFKMQEFLDLKQLNQGKWWIKGYEHDTELVDYVETWFRDWVGYCEESVFDVNILCIDQKNIIVNNYNQQAFDAFERWGVTPHICPIRHRYFWDGGVHCVTLDLDRTGTIQDYFPNRG